VSPSLAIALVALAAALALRWRRREQARARALEALAERVRELEVRLDATADDLASARSSSGVAESLLLEKGIADEDEVEATRRRLGGEATPVDDAVH
jgi:C4-dicarboxylate-specific signal transduction histidine kinase